MGTPSLRIQLSVADDITRQPVALLLRRGVRRDVRPTRTTCPFSCDATGEKTLNNSAGSIVDLPGVSAGSAKYDRHRLSGGHRRIVRSRERVTVFQVSWMSRSFQQRLVPWRQLQRAVVARQGAFDSTGSRATMIERICAPASRTPTAFRSPGSLRQFFFVGRTQFLQPIH